MSARSCDTPAAAERFRDKRRAAARDHLIVSYRPYVLKLARRLAEGVPYHVEIDDLVGWGHMGLVEAAARFDDSRGVAFRTFAHRRIQGAMFDGIRKHYGMSALPFEGALVVDRVHGVQVACADLGYEQVRHVLERELREAIAVAMDDLSPVERAIVRHHYFDGGPVIELAPSTRLSKSWLSRLHARALAKLRAALLAKVCGSEAYL